MMVMAQESLIERLQEALSRILNRKRLIENSTKSIEEKKAELEKNMFFESLLKDLLDISYIDNWRHYDGQLNQMLNKDPNLTGVVILVEFRPGHNYGLLTIKLG